MKVLVTTGWDPEGLEEVKGAFPQVEWVDGLTPEDRAAHIAAADVIFGHIDREGFRAAKNLKWVQSHSAGVDWLAGVPELCASDVIVTNTRGAHAQTIAEHTIGMLIFLARGFGRLWDAQQERNWLRPLDFTPVSLGGMTMGVIGIGNIGRAIARIANAIGMRIIAVDAHQVDLPGYVQDFWLVDEGLGELMKRADVAVVAVPYTPKTRNMIRAEHFTLMKPGSYFLAISRGGIVDEAALAEALTSGRLAGAGLDVQAEEPMNPENPLWDVPNLFITPHCSGSSTQTRADCMAIFQRNLSLFLDGKELQNVCDKQLGY